MREFRLIVLVNVLACAWCSNPSLKIIKSTGDYFIPISSAIVEEKAGANFSLLCDLVSSETDNNYYDFHVSWVKDSNDLRFWREYTSDGKKMYSILGPSQSGINKAVKVFDPLRTEDRGTYLCVSLKYGLHQPVEVVVLEEKPVLSPRPHQKEAIYCSDQMFQCLDGVCIIHHYICDGKADCKDGSDESRGLCNGDPCRDKLGCDDGRCIPTSWCCDRHHDPNCTVTHRPKCCDVLSEPYEDVEYGPSTLGHTHNGARYLFISIGALSILFIIVLFLLVVSRVMLLARKADPDPQGRPTDETIALHCAPPYSIDLIIDNCDVSDPLLLGRNGEDRPPSYGDAVRAQPSTLSLNEPPPPYTSKEVLNEGLEGDVVAQNI